MEQTSPTYCTRYGFHIGAGDDAGAPIGVQQKLMRHADITTKARNRDALMESKRKHNKRRGSQGTSLGKVNRSETEAVAPQEGV